MSYNFKHLKKEKVLKFKPDQNDITHIAHLFNSSGELPQTIIDKIVSSYDKKEGNFKEVEINLHEFYPVNKRNERSAYRMENALHSIYMTFKNR